jgi:hypothetical protein
VGDRRVTPRSQISGTIVETIAASAEFVDNSRRLFHIVNLDALWIEQTSRNTTLPQSNNPAVGIYRLVAYPDCIVPILSSGDD